MMRATVDELVRDNEPARAGRDGGGSIRRGDGRLRLLNNGSPPPGSTAIWVGISAIIMMFAAFTSALVVREGAALDWRHIEIPRILFLNTIVLLASSTTLEMFRRAFANRQRAATNVPGVDSFWLYVTFGLGLLFLAGQYTAWVQLNREGLYLASNPSSSFFYVLTGAHGLHVLGGLWGLFYVLKKSRRGSLRAGTLDIAAKYWHFMDILWLYLLGLLWIKL